MNSMINPRKINTMHERFSNRARGIKFYRTGFALPNGTVQFSRAKFKTASDAEDYGVKFILRWMRLYDAASAQSVTVPEAAETVNG